MFHRGANGEFVCGILNELNLAKVDEVLSENLFRTGTRGFLATDMLESVSTHHIERFDWSQRSTSLYGSRLGMKTGKKSTQML